MINLQNTEVQYLLLFTILLILPKLLLRFQIPIGISSIFLGIGAGLGLGWFQGDDFLLMLSRLGITSLFLFAGFEVEYAELKQNWKELLLGVTQMISITLIVAFAIHFFFSIGFRPATLIALGIMTPSTGFILNSLKNYGFSERQEYWIRSKAISKEISAILLLFITLQSESLTNLGSSTLVLVALCVLLPLAYKLFFKYIAPYSKDSEVGFLILTALICGVITKKIGTYYLVGAFIVGFIATEFKHFGKSEKSEEILKNLQMFFSFFIPFYFFKAGVGFTEDLFTLEGLYIGLAFLGIFIPLRIFNTYSNMKFFMQDFWPDRKEITVSLLPTLIFGLVMAQIAKERFEVPLEIISGLVIYTLVSSVIPAFIFKKVPPENY